MSLDPVTSINLLRLFVIRPLRNRRRAKKGLPPLGEQEHAAVEKVAVTLPSGEQIEREEPVIAARTSSKIAVGNGVVAAFPAVELLKWVQDIQFATGWLESFTNSPYFIYYGSLLISVVIARVTKSPIAKQAL